MEKYIIVLLAFIFSLGQFGRISLLGNEIVLHLNDLAVGVLVIVGFVYKRHDIFAGIKNSKITLPLSLWILVASVSLLINSSHLSVSQIISSGLYLLRFIVYSGLYFLILSFKPKIKIFARKSLLFSALIVAIIGILQYLFLPDVSFLKTFDWDDHYYRLISTFLDPGFTGAIFVLALIIIFAKTLFQQKTSAQTSFKKPHYVILGSLIFAALVLTYSRASYLMYAVALGMFSFYRKSSRIFLIGVIVLITTIVVLPRPSGEGVNLSRENSTLARLGNWQQSIRIWQQHLFLGIGFNSYRYEAKSSPQSHSGGADSSLLLILSTTGVVGMIVFLWLLWAIWQQGRNDIVFLASFAGVFVHSFFNNTLFYPWIMEWLWILLATIAI